jgi:hypothetical protein
MKKLLPFFALSAAVAGGGCASTQIARTSEDLVAASIGYVAGDQLSKDSKQNKVIAFGSGAVALGLKRFVDSRSDKKRMDELDQAFKRGMAQDAKVSYLAIQNSQRLGHSADEAAEAALPLTAIPIAAPARTINGVRVNPTVETIYIATK